MANMALMSKKELSKLKKHMAEYAKLKKENAELKSMLKLAMTDINSTFYCLSEYCDYCAYDCDKDACNNSEGFKWVHEEQALKLIGGEEQ